CARSPYAKGAMDYW
nr:immunoglobulin heavy chain junction region [Mus musculus]